MATTFKKSPAGGNPVASSQLQSIISPSCSAGSLSVSYHTTNQMCRNLKHTTGAIMPKFKQLSAGRFAKVETAKNLDGYGLIEKLTIYKYHRS